MHYEVEVNVGRKNGPPVWRAMLANDARSVATWTDRNAIELETRDQQWLDFRIVTVSDNGSRTVFCL